MDCMTSQSHGLAAYVLYIITLAPARIAADVTSVNTFASIRSHDRLLIFLSPPRLWSLISHWLSLGAKTFCFENPSRKGLPLLLLFSLLRLLKVIPHSYFLNFRQKWFVCSAKGDFTKVPQEPPEIPFYSWYEFLSIPGVQACNGQGEGVGLYSAR